MISLTCLSVKKICPLWSTEPFNNLPTQLEHDPALHEYGMAIPWVSATSKIMPPGGIFATYSVFTLLLMIFTSYYMRVFIMK